MLQTIKNAWKIPDLRKRMIFTLVILVLFRIGSVIQVPFVYAELAQSGVSGNGLQGLFQYFDIISGEAFGRATLFALSISPYITASIVIQLLTIAIPALERMSKEGEEGRKKLTQITRYTTIGLALLTSIGYYAYIKSLGWIVPATLDGINDTFKMFVIIACYCAGAAVIMWLAEKINEHGIGNGISLILFVNIAASFPSMVTSAWNNGLWVFVLFLIIMIAMVIFIVHVTNAERRIPVQYAKRQIGRKMYGGQSTFLPIKLNMSGVMPIIFASSIAAIPTTIAAIIPPKEGSAWYAIAQFFSSRSIVYIILYFVLIIAFSYFYLSISFNPVEVANNLKKNGGSVMGIRPGKPTVDYISKILGRVTLIGAVFLGLVATIPLLLGKTQLSGLAFGGSSLLILVSVVIETSREIEAQMTMRHYKGFLE